MAIFHFVSPQAFSVSWALYMIIASVWYSDMLFQPSCVRLAHKGKEPELDLRALAASAFGSLVAISFFCFVLSVARCRSPIEGLLWGLTFGIFDAGIGAAHCFFEERPVQLFFIHKGCHAVGLISCGLLLGMLCT